MAWEDVLYNLMGARAAKTAATDLLTPDFQSDPRLQPSGLGQQRQQQDAPLTGGGDSLVAQDNTLGSQLGNVLKTGLMGAMGIRGLPLRLADIYAQAGSPMNLSDPNAPPTSPTPAPIQGAPNTPTPPTQGGGLVDQITKFMTNPLVAGGMGTLAGALAVPRHATAGQRVGSGILGGFQNMNETQRMDLLQKQQDSVNQLRQQQAEAYKKQQEIDQQKQDVFNALPEDQKRLALFPGIRPKAPSETAVAAAKKEERSRIALFALNLGARDLLQSGQVKTQGEGMMRFIDAHPEIYDDLPKPLQDKYDKLTLAPTAAKGVSNPALKNFPLEQRARMVELMTQAGQDPDKDAPSPEVMKAAREGVRQSKVQVGVTIADARGSSYATNREKMQEKYARWAATQRPIDPKTVSSYMTPTGQTPQADQRFKNVGTITPQNLSDSGYRAIAPEFQRGFKAGATALTQIDRIEKAGEQLFKGVKQGENIGNAFVLNGKKLFGDAAVRGFEAVVLETMPTNAVQSGLTPGRVGDKVIEKIEMPIMPNVTDTYDSFKAKIHNIRQRVKNNMAVMYGDGIDPALIAGEESYNPQQQQPGITVTPSGGAGGSVTKLRRNPQTNKLEEVQ